MIAKIVSGHGTGSAAPAIHYIAGEKDHKGDVRDEVIHLFGDGQQVIGLTESMTCKHTYLSSVLSFTKEESARLNLDDIQQLAESFASHHAEPMGVESIASCAYLHVEDGRYDVHLIQAQLDLETGKRVDLYLDMCGDTQRIADWQDCQNYEMKLEDPRDPSRARLNNDKVRESKGREEIRKLVNNHLLQQTINGEITSRDDVMIELKSLGFEIMRQTKKSISIKSPSLNQNIRLTGGIFHESFTGIEGVGEAIKAGQLRSEEDYRAEYESARVRLTSSNKKRTERISKKLKINIEERSIRTQEFDIYDFHADIGSGSDWLPATDWNWGLGDPTGQYVKQNGEPIDLPNPGLSREGLRHRPSSQRNHRQQRQLLDQTQLTGAMYETTYHKIPGHSAHVARAGHHAETMRGLSTSSREIEQASQKLGSPGESGGSPFDQARKAVVESISEIANHIETIALRMKQLFSHSSAEGDDAAKGSDISSDDVGY